MSIPSRTQHPRRAVLRSAAHALVLIALLWAAPAGAAPSEVDRNWTWPTAGARDIVEPFRAPAHAYGPGHRGIDIVAATGTAVHAPADGVVAYRGVIVDRPLLTIDHGGGIVTTFEPLVSDLLPGTTVHGGDQIGIVGAGGHAPAGAMHVGVRLHGVYINPLLLFGEVERAVLLPCCGAVTREGARVDRSP